jgi:hypothetical protein
VRRTRGSTRGTRQVATARRRRRLAAHLPNRPARTASRGTQDRLIRCCPGSAERTAEAYPSAPGRSMLRDSSVGESRSGGRQRLVFSLAPVLPDEVAQLRTDLGGVPGVVAVVLGGSRAAGTARPDSDWDVGVYYRGGAHALNTPTMCMRWVCGRGYGAGCMGTHRQRRRMAHRGRHCRGSAIPRSRHR